MRWSHLNRKRKRHSWVRWAAGATVLCSLLLADSNLRLVTTEYELAFPELPAGFDGFRVVQLSDIHGAVYGRDNVRLLRAVERARPDLIAITGDLADADSDLADVEALLTELTRLAPVYYVTGNHEWSDGLLPALKPMLERQGVRYLSNEYVLLEREGDTVVLAGVDDPNGYATQPKPPEVADTLPENSFRILLGHRNDWLTKYPELPVDLILCGHAHGGLVRLPFLGGVLGRGRELFPDYTAGVYDSGRCRMVVSRGVGPIMGLPRFWNNPELVAVTLRKAK